MSWADIPKLPSTKMAKKKNFVKIFIFYQVVITKKSTVFLFELSFYF